VSPSSSRSEATTRASSIGLAVFMGVFARRSRAFIEMLDSVSSTTTGTSSNPSACQRESRLNPSMTSKVPPPEGATRIGMGARSERESLRAPLRSQSVVRSFSIATISTALMVAP
jgi:hypothetical protein